MKNLIRTADTKRIALVAVFFFWATFAFSQDYTASFLFDGKLYKVSVDQKEDKFVEVVIGNPAGDKEEKFMIRPFTVENFKAGFQSSFKALDSTVDAKIAADATNFDTSLSRLFINAVAGLLTEESEAPDAGTLIVESTVDVFLPASKKAKRAVHEANKGKEKSAKADVPESTDAGDLEVSKVQIDFQDGFIERILVSGKIGTEKVHFDNNFGIGFSSQKNYDLLDYVRLYDAAGRYIIAGDLLDYEYTVRNQTRDFSPGDGAHTFFPGEHRLKKEESKKILEAIVFSDFAGLNQDNPNGLIQTEVGRRINLNTNRHQVFRYLPWKAFGTFQHITPRLLISKFEENNKNLLLHQQNVVKDDTLTSTTYTTALELYRYQNFSAGFDVNVLLLDNPEQKFIFTANAGIRFLRTAVRDSLVTLSGNDVVKTKHVNDFGVNSFQSSVEERLHFLPDERYGFILSARQIYHYLADTRVQQKSFSDSNPDRVASDTNRWLNSFELLGYVNLSDRGKLFARYRITHEWKNFKNNFQQIQLGYSFYIFGKQ